MFVFSKFQQNKSYISIELKKITIENKHSCCWICRWVFNWPQLEGSYVAAWSTVYSKVAIICRCKETFSQTLVGVVIACHTSTDKGTKAAGDNSAVVAGKELESIWSQKKAKTFDTFLNLKISNPFKGEWYHWQTLNVNTNDLTNETSADSWAWNRSSLAA